MNRREILAASAATLAAAPVIAQAVARLPDRQRINVAFLIGDGANVIDTAGPWEVFQDTMTGEGAGMRHPFKLYTVGPSTDVLKMTGGLLVKPHFSVDDAPEPNVIVVPAQRSTEATRAWLKAMSPRTDVTMSVCTGAFQLGRVGLLDGLPATTHHDFFDAFEKEFPKTSLQRGPRFVDNGKIATAGGLTSGIDLALHVVERYFGQDTRKAVARYMEHASGDWRAA
ncbi:DJ-1/PfpI family protein [Phenylobacterium sp. J367]|uniref:DJ-1/PfpI family protein n=1 Tax=Phenylobacterium sp. J367 TaxID=2898435 RepID=UPI002151C017|nr:DJ-1/PfpI family protein [Phenylobacterium sp. J367]MCR5878974.1 DJ-1/PfpI family protein [Phenylobacterium sp. J367]